MLFFVFLLGDFPFIWTSLEFCPYRILFIYFNKNCIYFVMPRKAGNEKYAQGSFLEWPFVNILVFIESSLKWIWEKDKFNFWVYSLLRCKQI